MQQQVQHKVVYWLALALGIVIWMAGSAFAATPWPMAEHSKKITVHGEHPAPHHASQTSVNVTDANLANANVQVRSNFYSPASVTIHVGETVTWTRVAGFHNVLADDGSFRLGELPDGEPGGSWITASHTFTQTGTFKYHCEFHGLSMAGEVVVQSNDDPIAGIVALNSDPTLLHNATTFTATVTGGTNISYMWNFGDGQNGAGQTTSHTYTAAGVYTATVTATNNQGSQTATTVAHVAMPS